MNLNQYKITRQKFNFMKKLLLLAVLMLYISCTTGDNNAIVNDFKGYYKISSIVSETAIDLNNDGIKSADILLELSSPHVTLNGVFTDFYNVSNPKNFAEIRPTEGQTNPTQFISFNFPEQSISYLNDDLSLNTPILMHYTTSMNVSLFYKINNQNGIEIIDNDTEWNSQFGVINSLQRMDKSNFEVDLDKRMFDFASKQWLVLKVKANYQKVE